MMLYRNWAVPIGIICVALSACTNTPSAPKAGPLASHMHAALDALQGFSGTVLVVDAGEITFAEARGLADAESARPISIDDTWRWASVTKQIVAVLILQEIEIGRLRLNTRVDDVLPELTGGRLGDVTIKDLLQHTSGLNNPAGLELDVFNTSFDWRGFCPVKAGLEAESGFSYNNCDYILLGEIIRVVSGASWEEQLQARILGPAGMTRTGVAQAETVTGYLSDTVPAPYHNLGKFGASGAITGDVHDLAKFNAALMTGVLLSPGSLEVLWTGEPGLGYQALGAWSFPAPLSGCPKPVQLVERRGDIGGVQVRNLMAPALNRSLIVLTNRADLEFGEIWMGAGLSFELASRAFCDAPA